LKLNNKKLGFLVAAIVVVIILVGLIIWGVNKGNDTTKEGSQQEESQTTEQTEDSADSSKEEEQSEVKNEAELLTVEKYKQIENGMTYDEVKQIIGSDGEVMSEAGEKGSEVHTVMYKWETGDENKAANFTFQGGQLIDKTQIGLE
jgi:cytoskeletal protein RodZ